ncbi:hypothetical protein EVA_22118, partial [gut metagenome]
MVIVREVIDELLAFPYDETWTKYF